MTENSAPYNADPPPGPKEASVELYSQEGDTPRTIRVYVDHRGDLEIGSQDFPSERLRPFAEGGATEYCYFTTVEADAKDLLIVTLLGEKFMGNSRAVEEFETWCKSKGIPCRFSTWGTGHFDD
jgi:hypothetical protein